MNVYNYSNNYQYSLTITIIRNIIEYLAVSNSGFPVLMLTLKRAFDTQAWSAVGNVCFQPVGSGGSSWERK